MFLQNFFFKVFLMSCQYIYLVQHNTTQIAVCGIFLDLPLCYISPNNNSDYISLQNWLISCKVHLGVLWSEKYINACVFNLTGSFIYSADDRYLMTLMASKLNNPSVMKTYIAYSGGCEVSECWVTGLPPINGTNCWLGQLRPRPKSLLTLTGQLFHSHFINWAEAKQQQPFLSFNKTDTWHLLHCAQHKIQPTWCSL